MAKYLDDLFIFIGCCLIMVGTFILIPVATWFVAGIMCLAVGIVIGIGGSKTK